MSETTDQQAARDVERARLEQAVTRLQYITSARSYPASLPSENLRQAVSAVEQALWFLRDPSASGHPGHFSGAMPTKRESER